jgi:uncharacterized protein (TIGR03435 family)
MLSIGIRMALVVLSGGLAYGQTFDVASVKPVSQTRPDGRIIIGMAPPTGGPGTKDPGRVHYPAISLKFLLFHAYPVKVQQLVAPDWLDTAFFEIEATMPPETTKDQFQTMLQNLLADRFRLKIHRETRELPAYSLMVARNGPKLKEAVETPAQNDGTTRPSPQRPQIGADGYMIAPRRPGLFVQTMRDRTRLTFQQATVESLAGSLETQLAAPVTDATGLTRKYDFILTFSSEGIAVPGFAPPPPPGGAAPGTAAPETETPPDVFTALQSQLGLKLEQKKAPVEVIVIDHIEKTPTAN